MKNTSFLSRGGLGRGALALSLAFPLTGGLSAQTTAPTAAPRDVTELEKFVVTGSNIPSAADTLAVPVTVVSQAEIQRTGIGNNLLEVIRKRMPFFAGNSNLGNSNGNTAGNSTQGGSQVSLRNLTTLVLINGRRVASNGTNGRGGRDFVDVNQIPVAAIERIETLTDGASAIYGSDAIGGVVNIILRTDYRGAEFGGRYGFASGDYTERSAYAVVGGSDGKMSATVSVNWAASDPLFQKDRAFSSPILNRTATISGAVGAGSAFPTAQLASGVTSPRTRNPVGTAATATSLNDLIANGTYVPATFATVAATFDLAPYVTLLLDQEQKSAFASFNYKILDTRLEVFSDFLYSNTRSLSQLAAQPSTPNITIPAGAPYNPLTVPFTQVGFRYAPAPRQFLNDSDLTRAVVGLRGRFGDNYTWEVAYNGNENNLNVKTRNVLYSPNVNRAVAGGFNAQGVPTPGGTYSRVITGYSEAGTNFVFQPALDALALPTAIDPASLENVLGTANSDFVSKLSSIDLKLAGTPFEIYAGEVGFAIGGDFRTEKLQGLPDDNTRLSRWLGATFFAPFTRERDISAGFAELRVPLAGPKWSAPGLHAFDFTAAYRIEDYSDAGKSDVPKYGIRWQPIDDQVTIRATYSEAFAAPTLYALSGPTTQGFTATNVVPNVFGVNGQAQSRTGSNPNLKPSTADTYSYGVAISPKAIKGLTVSVDYVDVDQIELVGTTGVTTILQSVNQLGTASPYAAQAGFGDFPGTAGFIPVTRAGELADFLAAGNSANLIFVSDTNVNIAGQRVKALDLSVNYVLPTAGFGTFDVSSITTFFLDYRFQALPSEAYFEYAGHTSAGGSGSQGTIPGYRTYTNLGWTLKNLSLSLGHTYIPSVKDIGPGGQAFVTSATLKAQHVSSYSQWDIQASYTFKNAPQSGPLSLLKGVKLTAGVNNVLDKLPPLAPQAFNDSNVDLATYGAIGRLVFVSAGVKF